ncbi:2-polyprenyl-6-methoxyphenol hydroxylase and related FAD-dependent oxidoreductase [Methylophaga aminisulfidivorans MP]|uniref:2-polyprenyl-6-methoxyphenol hydroxylase and related FAD-dependent oxidoreductase n=1 Tax=Methylophaga aminisulfidivorans MP TaxID=1026882 RepID=F5T308_9GAMM|nr:2-polyprenyl-6-methoxyphenol hydroxylase and related FAD-dependent oxidoreductase [Methylophaga aminisulfidivorans MP]
MNHGVFDVLIVGGGMAGASLAIALKNSQLKIGLIEAKSLETDSQPSYDDRGIALSYGSQRIFDTMGIWSHIAQHASPIHHIHVSERGRFGVTRLSAEQEQVPALGQVITARHLGHSLNRQLLKLSNLTLFCPAMVTSVLTETDKVKVTLGDGAVLETKLIVAADGRNSTIRHYLKLGAWEQDYNQVAVTANISTDKPHQGWAYERFTASGPMALLPMTDKRSSLVWTVKAGEKEALLAMPEHAFLERLQSEFGYRAGRFTRVGQRNSHPLILMQADMPVQPRIVFIGNAAHSLHPIAGQGFNLGLRDVAVLAEHLFNAKDCGDAELLKNYQEQRQQDQNQVVKSTDHLVKLFSNNIPVLGHLRGAGLTLVDAMPVMKHWLATKSMGLAQAQPKLARGVPLR